MHINTKRPLPKFQNSQTCQVCSQWIWKILCGLNISGEVALKIAGYMVSSFLNDTRLWKCPTVSPLLQKEKQKHHENTTKAILQNDSHLLSYKEAVDVFDFHRSILQQKKRQKIE